MNKRYTKLSDIVEIISGGTPKTSVPEYWNGSIPWLAVNDFAGDSRWVYSAEKSVTQLGVQKSATKILNKGDLIISARGTVGELAELAVPMAFNQSCFGLRGKNNTDTEYLYYLLKFNMPKIQVVANGATFGTIVLDTFDRIKLESFDDLNVQRKVSTILSRYDEAIENNSKRIKLLEQMAQNLYKEWFVRFRFPGWQNAEFENGMPKGWHYKKLFEVVNVTYGYAFASELFCDDETLNPVVRIRNILDNQTNTFTSETCADKYIIKENEILIGMDGIFHMCMWNGEKAYQNQRVVKLTSKTNEISNYFLFLAVQPQVKFWEQTIAGTTVAHLGDKHLKRMNVLLPSEKVLKEATKIFDSLMKQKNQLFKANQNLANQRDLLLPGLMSGKLEV